MKTRTRKPVEGTKESPEKKLSRLIEKLNAELKVMNEIKPELVAENPDSSKKNNPEPKKRRSTLKPKQP